MKRFFCDPHYAPPRWRRWAALFFIVTFFLLGGLWLRQYQHDEQTVTNLPVRDMEHPVARETKTVHLPPERNYVAISIPFDAIAMNKLGDVVGSLDREDGGLDFMLWIAGNTFNISEVTGQAFTQILDVNDDREILGVVKQNGHVYLKGYAYRTVPETELIQVRPLPRIELRRFGLEDLTIETDLSLDSSVGQVSGRKVKVRSIIDMTESGIILADEEEESTPANQPSEKP